MPGLLRPLPDRPADEAFPQALRALLAALGVTEVPTSEGAVSWVRHARIACREAVADGVPETAFDALIEAAVHDPNPSFNRQFVEPALLHFGRRRVQTAIIERMREGDDRVKAGAARAWYWAQASSGFLKATGTPRPKNITEWEALAERREEYRKAELAEHESLADLRKRWRELTLAEFLSNADLDVRRCLIPGLDLDAASWPKEWRARVAEAIAIARAHPDEYIRHRVEHQVPRAGEPDPPVR